MDGKEAKSYNLTDCKPLDKTLSKTEFNKLLNLWYTKAHKSGYINIEYSKINAISYNRNTDRFRKQHQYDSVNEYIRVLEIWAYSDHVKPRFKLALQEYLYNPETVITICKRHGILQKSLLEYISKYKSAMIEYAVLYNRGEEHEYKYQRPNRNTKGRRKNSDNLSQSTDKGESNPPTAIG